MSFDKYSISQLECIKSLITYIIRRPLECSSESTCSLPQHQRFGKACSFSGTNIHIDGPGPSFCHNSCRGSTEGPLQLSCDEEEKNTGKWRSRLEEENQRREIILIGEEEDTRRDTEPQYGSENMGFEKCIHAYKPK